MTHVTLRPEFETLIDPYAPVGQVGSGFEFTEGPIWHPVHHYLLFSDMPGDVRRRWDAKRGVVDTYYGKHLYRIDCSLDPFRIRSKRSVLGMDMLYPGKLTIIV